MELLFVGERSRKEDLPSSSSANDKSKDHLDWQPILKDLPFSSSGTVRSRFCGGCPVPREAGWRSIPPEKKGKKSKHEEFRNTLFFVCEHF